MTSVGTSGAGVGGGLGTLLGGGVVIANIVGLFVWTWVSISTLGFLAVLIGLRTIPGLAPKDDGLGLTKLGQAATVLAGLSAVVCGPLVGWLQVVAFKTAAMITVGLFVISLFALLASSALSGLSALIQVVLALTMSIAVMVLPPPPGSPDADEKNWTTIVVTVVTKNNTPISQAGVRFDLQTRSDDTPWFGFRHSSSVEGKVTWRTFRDPRGKLLVVRVWASQRGSDAQEDAREELRDIARGERREVTVTLK